MERVAVIGAGTAGLAAASRLKSAGLDVTVLEAGEGAGGRIASQAFAGATVDVGALYATAREAAFQDAVQEAVFAGRATGWAPRGRPGDEPWMIGLPSMDALLRPFAEGLDIVTGTRVERIGTVSEGYILQTKAQSPGPFDAVVVAVPAPLAAPLLDAHGKPFDQAGEAVMRPALAVLLAFDAALDLGVDVLNGAGPLATAARHGSRAGREGREIWVLHATHDFSEAWLDADPPAIAQLVFQAFLDRAGADNIPAPVDSAVHAWPHAFVERPLGAPCLVGANRRIAACGDWCLGARVEAAFLSGRAAADALLA